MEIKWSFICKNSKFPPPKDFCAKFDWSWSSGSGEEDFPLGKGLALHLSKIKSPSSKNALCHVWLKLAKWFWKKMKMWKVYETDNDKDGQRLRQKTNKIFGIILDKLTLKISHTKKSGTEMPTKTLKWLNTTMITVYLELSWVLCILSLYHV